VQKQNMNVLPIREEHVLKLGELPSLHRDPFDRILVAQALVENVALVSRDSALKRYGVKVIW
jgi:PIN domain nuclease of toxin-antitoxin system